MSLYCVTVYWENRSMKSRYSKLIQAKDERIAKDRVKDHVYWNIMPRDASIKYTKVELVEE